METKKNPRLELYRKATRRMRRAGTIAIILCFVAVIVTTLSITLTTFYIKDTEKAYQTNMKIVLDERSRQAYQLLCDNDWAGFTEFYQLQSTYYTTGDVVCVSMTSNRMVAECLVIRAESIKDPRVRNLSIKKMNHERNNDYTEAYDDNEPYPILVAIDRHPVFFSASSAASLCARLSGLIRE